MATAGIGELNAQRPAASSGGGIEPSAPTAAALQPAGLQAVAPGPAMVGPPLVEPDDNVAAPALPDEAPADLGAETDVEPPLVVVVGAFVGGGGAELDDGLGEGGGAGALSEYCAGVVPAGG